MKTYLINILKNVLNNKIRARIISTKRFSSVMLSTFLLSAIVSINVVNAVPENPKVTSAKYVNDYVGVIDDNSHKYILSVGRELEDKTGAQAIVVVINSLEGEPIESYANGIFRKWGIGQKDKNNGLLILLAIKEKTWRVEVGTGLEGAITDIYSSRVMTDFAVPKFKISQYGEGLKEAYSVLSDSIAKEYGVTLDKNINVPKYTESEKNLGVSKRENGILIMGGVLIVFLDLVLNRGRFTRFMIKLLFWSSILRRGGSGRNGGNSGGFGGGSSSGGGSSGSF